MCSRNDLIAYLQKLPEDVNIQIIKEVSYAFSTTTEWQDLDLDEYSDNCNLYGKTLYLGED